MTKRPTGLLILHGFTGSLDTVKAVVPVAERLQMPYLMPVLRGHGSNYRDLIGVKAYDWYADAEDALKTLLQECEQVIVVGLSMGGVVALNLAMQYREQIQGLILLAPALQLRDPLTKYAKYVKRVIPFWKAPSSFSDRKLERLRNTNYAYFPLAALDELMRFSEMTIKYLDQVKCNVVTLFSKKDRTVSPLVPGILSARLGGKHELLSFQRSGHEMLLDCEAERVVILIEHQLRVWLNEQVDT